MARLKVITGPMNSGKSEKVIRDLKTPGYINKRILILKPKKDNRIERDVFRMIRDDKFLSTYTLLEMKLLDNSPDHFKSLINIAVPNQVPNIIVIEEIHMLEVWLTPLIRELLDIKCSDPEFTIITVGLDKDHLQVPWEPTLTLMAHADNVEKLLAICSICGQAAPLTYKIGGTPHLRLETGGKYMYEARCRTCHKLPSTINI